MKLIVKIMNIIYLAFAAVAITCFATKPFVDIQGSYALSTEVIAGVLPEEIKDQVSEQELKDAFKDEDGNEIPLTVPLNLHVPAKMIIQFWDKEQIKTSFNGIITDTVGNVVDQLHTPIHNLAVIIAKKTANKTIYDQILAQVQSAQSSSSEEAAEKMKEAGIDDAYISGFTDEVYEKLSEEGATFDNVMGVVQTRMDDVAAKLDITGFDPAVATSEVEANLKDALKEANLMNEDGTINDIDTAITTLLLSFLDGNNPLFGGNTDNTDSHAEGDEGHMDPPEIIPDEDSEPTEKSYLMRVLEVRAEDSGEVEDKEAELTQKITDKIMELVNKKNIVDVYAQFAFIPFILLCLLALPWLILAIVSIVRIIRPKKCWVRPWYVFVFAFAQLILGLGLTILTTKFLPNIGTILPKFISDPSVVDGITNALSSLNLSIFTSSYIPSILYLVMIPVTIVYMILSRKVKKAFKAEKKAKKEAKRAAKAA